MNVPIIVCHCLQQNIFLSKKRLDVDLMGNERDKYDETSL